MSERHEQADVVASARRVILDKSVLHLDEPVQLASGQMSSVFVDGKAGLAEADDLMLACRAIVALAEAAGVDFDVVGGPTMGADHLAVGIAIATGTRWCFVRKEPKGRGTGKLIEGAALGPGSRVLVVEDAVSTGASLLQAYDHIVATGATVTGVAALIDRGGHLGPVLAERGVPFLTIATWADAGLDPVAGP